jgi:serine/threonine-protein kinase RsbW
MSEQGSTWSSEQVIPSDPAAGKQVLEELLRQLHVRDWLEHDVFGVHLAMEEALVNAIKHGNKQDVNKRVRVACHVSKDKVRIEIADEGPGFKLEDVPDCTDLDRLDVPSGRGIMLMRSFMSSVEYNERGNCVVMEKERGSDSLELATE